MLPMLLRPPEEPSMHLISVNRTGRGVSIVGPEFCGVGLRISREMWVADFVWC
jgi:hypothetical protein